MTHDLFTILPKQRQPVCSARREALPPSWEVLEWPKKVPVTVFVDPDVETQLTIKPFAAGLAATPQAAGSGGPAPEGISGTVTGTGIGAPNPDVDADVDYNG